MVRPRRLVTRRLPWLLALAALLVACSKPSPTVSSQVVSGTLSVTPTFTATPSQAPDALPSPPTVTSTYTPVEPATATPSPSPTLPPTPTPTPELGPVESPTAEPGPLPAVLAQVSLAPAEETLQDLLLDPGAGRLYVTDTADQLHVLDADSYAQLAVLPAAGNLTLDAARGRLYVWKEATWESEGGVTVVDVASLAIIGTVSPGGFVAVDNVRNRFYVGNRVYYRPSEDTPGVRVYDGTTLEQVGEVPQPGIPVYNPLRDELLVVAYTAHQVDPVTWSVSGDLLPEISQQPLPWCNGCRAATGAHVFPERELLLVEMTTLSTGGGPGWVIGPRFFDASTLDEITALSQMPAVQRGCEDRLILAEPVSGRTYRSERFVRYIVFNNLLVYGSDGRLETWRDGLPLGITNPNTVQMYLPHGDDL
ncbi:MAG: hypothetical protein JSV36_01555, partial [Anaerolineae bacterium]